MPSNTQMGWLLQKGVRQGWKLWEGKVENARERAVPIPYWTLKLGRTIGNPVAVYITRRLENGVYLMWPKITDIVNKIYGNHIKIIIRIKTRKFPNLPESPPPRGSHSEVRTRATDLQKARTRATNLLFLAAAAPTSQITWFQYNASNKHLIT